MTTIASAGPSPVALAQPADQPPVTEVGWDLQSGGQHWEKLDLGDSVGSASSLRSAVKGARALSKQYVSENSGWPINHAPAPMYGIRQAQNGAYDIVEAGHTYTMERGWDLFGQDHSLEIDRARTQEQGLKALVGNGHWIDLRDQPANEVGHLPVTWR